MHNFQHEGPGYRTVHRKRRRGNRLAETFVRDNLASSASYEPLRYGSWVAGNHLSFQDIVIATKTG